MKITEQLRYEIEQPNRNDALYAFCLAGTAVSVG